MYLKDISRVYFIGIGGIGMSALARWFRHFGCEVAGYDRTRTTLTEQLEKEGIAVHYIDDVNLIPESFRTPQSCLIVYTPAVPSDHKELIFFRTNGFSELKRSQILGRITQDLFTIGISGTHGKTTTSSMTAHLLTAAGKNCTAFLGGITQNYGTNLLLGKADSNEDPLVVAEADEFDRSFLTLFPNVAVVTSMDADHLDIYGTHDEIKKSFHEFVAQIKNDGVVIIKKGLEVSIPEHVHGYTYSCGQPADFSAINIRIEAPYFTFDLDTPNGKIKDLQIQVPGFHNVENATAAAAVALLLGVSETNVREGLRTYLGVKRRFEYIYRSESTIYIDDYAHHPAETEAFIKSAKALYPDRKVTVIFQPHLYSRTRDFASEFATSLSLADEVILLDIYPAREQPIEGVTSEIIFNEIKSPEKQLCRKSDLMQVLTQKRRDVLVTMGAGDIDTFIIPIRDWLTEIEKK
ncbi:UDP-N-acetylmuramate--L-alanine ligase [Cytophagaceae bacterium YF14B1]|uniref:UDP-N-acetylmuramate--L-alanine ligase n=1 Tax=Xanthocytophaga flava TaxID=3048013 RepID=A0AAE3QPK0_9BACT|nr:UDP-N-acetylmuramate--L-alanine ligase [Xanthocytophaga flavus]MDJ1480368.1 UDP-N-acetylmuramate--L-alanine ligase [Xanthocytophaga flavus]